MSENTHRFYKVLTPKGLAFVIHSLEATQEQKQAARDELRRRKAALTQHQPTARRELDGYEKDR